MLPKVNNTKEGFNKRFFKGKLSFIFYLSWREFTSIYRTGKKHFYRNFYQFYQFLLKMIIFDVKYFLIHRPVNTILIFGNYRKTSIFNLITYLNL